MQEKYTKISKNKQIDAIGARRATMGHLVGQLTPPYHRSTWNFKCLLTNLWEVAKKHTSKPSPLLIPSQCMIKGQKEASHGFDDSPSSTLGAQMDKIRPYPHSTTTQGAPHQKRRAHSIVAHRPTPYPHRPAPLSGSTASPSNTCKETHLGAILCISLRRFKVGLIQGQGEGVTQIDDVALE